MDTDKDNRIKTEKDQETSGVSMGLNPGSPSEYKGSYGLDPSGSLLDELRHEMDSSGEDMGLEPEKRKDPEIPFRHLEEVRRPAADQEKGADLADEPGEHGKNGTHRDGNDDRNIRQLSRGRLVFLCVLMICLGVLLATGCIGLFMSGKGGIHLVSGDKLKYYKALDKQWGKYYEIQKTISDSDLYKTDSDKMEKAVISGMLSALPDPYAQYMTKSEYDSFSRKYLDSYTGIGISVQAADDGQVIVGKVINGSTADEAGLQKGDVIVSIRGSKPESVENAAELLRGKAGTSVTVVVSRGGREKTFRVARAQVEDKALEYRVYDKGKGIGYIDFNTFRTGASEELSDAITDLKNQGCTKVIIDLRGNPGGVADEGIKCADILLPACRIVTVKNASGKEKIYNSDSSSKDVSYVVLVDGETASAAEIFACAVKDNGGGKIIGSRTYGKGLIQGIFPLEDGSVIKLTVEEYVSPSGEKIDGKGVEPDIQGEGDVIAQGADVLAAS